MVAQIILYNPGTLYTMTPSENVFLPDLNKAFKEDGAWEKNEGKQQTRLFAEYFDQVITFRQQKFSLLDVGCALGQAAVFFSRRYPHAAVSATDVSDVAIERCRRQYGDRVHFFTGGFGKISEFYDVIYCSNVLEHFHDCKEKLRQLAGRCQRLCCMVPYDERARDGQELMPDPTSIEHQITFFKDSFDFLVEEGLAETVQATIISCPGAWGWSRRQKITHGIDNFWRKMTKRPTVNEYLQIIFDIKTTQQREKN